MVKVLVCGYSLVQCQVLFCGNENTASFLHMYIFLCIYTGCPTTYQTQQFFNNSNTNDDIVTRFEQEYVHCVKNEEECICSVCL
jgi:hypothetical protein